MRLEHLREHFEVVHRNQRKYYFDSTDFFCLCWFHDFFFSKFQVWLVLMKSVKVDLLIAQLWYLMSKSIGRILQLWNPDLCVVLWKNVEKNFKVVETLVTMLTRNIGYQKNSVRVQYHPWVCAILLPNPIIGLNLH